MNYSTYNNLTSLQYPTGNVSQNRYMMNSSNLSNSSNLQNSSNSSNLSNSSFQSSQPSFVRPTSSIPTTTNSLNPVMRNLQTTSLPPNPNNSLYNQKNLTTSPMDTKKEPSFPEKNYIPSLPTVIEEKKSPTMTYILIFCLVIAVGVIIFLIYLDSNTRSRLIQPKNCPVIKSNYASIPSVVPSSLQTLNSCSKLTTAYAGTDPCEFSNIPSVIQAEELCSKYSSSICSGFAYNPANNSVRFVNTSFAIVSTDGLASPNYEDVYLKQV